jgi:AP-1 complex subunit sigma 1/2
MAIRFLLLVSRQGGMSHVNKIGKVRLTKWFISDWGTKEKVKTVKEVSSTVLARKPKMCNVLEYKGIF